MRINKAFIVGVGRYSYHNDDPGEITGVRMITPEGLPVRLCFEVCYPDGVIDYIAVSDALNENQYVIGDSRIFKDLAAVKERRIS